MSVFLCWQVCYSSFPELPLVAASPVIAGAQPSGTLLRLSDTAHLEASTTNIAAAGFAASNENPSTS